MLIKLRHVLNNKTLRSVYYAIFESHLCCAALTALIIYYRKSSQNWFFKVKILKQVFYLKTPKFLILLIRLLLKIGFSKSFKYLLPSVFSSWFRFSSETHSHDTRWGNHGYLQIPFYRTKTYGRYSMVINEMHAWNHLHSCYLNIEFNQSRIN